MAKEKHVFVGSLFGIGVANGNAKGMMKI